MQLITLAAPLLLVLLCITVSANFYNKKNAYHGDAVTSNNPECAAIGMDIFKKHNGTAVDAMIATLFCEGVVFSHGTGIGGGFVATIYKKASGKAETIMARERAPHASTFDMFTNMESVDGILSIGVPAALKGYAEMHEKYGRTPWKVLIEPSIKLCRSGYKISKTVDFYMNVDVGHLVRKSPSILEVFTNPKTGKLMTTGDEVKRIKLAETLEIIAEEGADSMYTANGKIAKRLVHEIKELGGILTMEDFTSFKTDWNAPIKTKLRDGYTLNSVPLPASGLILSLITNILYEYEPSVSVPYLHKMAESFKYAYAKRTNLGDQFDNKKILDEFTDMNYANHIRDLISKNNQTFNDFRHYGAKYALTENHGTAHVSVLSRNGDAVAATGSLNDAFGSKIRSRSTGIILNNSMDDFSTPGITNIYGMKPSPANYVEPRKRPMSSMTPSIVTDKNGDAVFIIGAAGGSKITTIVAYIIARHIWMKESLKDAVFAKRMHHQLLPMQLVLEQGTDEKLVEGLRKMGHKIVHNNPIDGFASVTAISRISGYIEAVFDPRRTGSTEINVESTP